MEMQIQAFPNEACSRWPVLGPFFILSSLSLVSAYPHEKFKISTFMRAAKGTDYIERVRDVV